MNLSQISVNFTTKLTPDERQTRVKYWQLYNPHHMICGNYTTDFVTTVTPLNRGEYMIWFYKNLSKNVIHKHYYYYIPLNPADSKRPQIYLDLPNKKLLVKVNINLNGKGPRRIWCLVFLKGKSQFIKNLQKRGFIYKQHTEEIH